MSEEKITDLYEWGNKEKIVRPNVVNENLPKDISIDTIKVTTATTETENATKVNATNVKATSTETENLTATGDIHLTNPHVQGGINTDVIQATNDLSVLVGDNEIINVGNKIKVSGNIQPTSDASITLGSKTNNFKNVYTSRIYNGEQEVLSHRNEVTKNVTRLSNDVSYLQLEHNIAEEKNHLILFNKCNDTKGYKFVDMNLDAYTYDEERQSYKLNWELNVSNTGVTNYIGKQIWLSTRYYDTDKHDYSYGGFISITDTNVNLDADLIKINGKLDVNGDINLRDGTLNVEGKSLEDAERSWYEGPITLSSSSTTIDLTSYSRERNFRYVMLTFETLYDNNWVQVANTILYLNDRRKIMINYPQTLTFDVNVSYDSVIRKNKLTIVGAENTRVSLSINTRAV